MATQTDPICGMELEDTQAMVQFTYKGELYYFCSLDCNRKFCELLEETSKAFNEPGSVIKAPDSVENN